MIGIHPREAILPLSSWTCVFTSVFKGKKIQGLLFVHDGLLINGGTCVWKFWRIRVQNQLKQDSKWNRIFEGLKIFVRSWSWVYSVEEWDKDLYNRIRRHWWSSAMFHEVVDLFNSSFTEIFPTLVRITVLLVGMWGNKEGTHT